MQLLYPTQIQISSSCTDLSIKILWLLMILGQFIWPVHTLMSREKIYSQLSHLEKGRMGSLVNSHSTTLQAGTLKSAPSGELPWLHFSLQFENNNFLKKIF